MTTGFPSQSARFIIINRSGEKKKTDVVENKSEGRQTHGRESVDTVAEGKLT
jgi:hypothetical protein